jgi:hypothetical protein
MAELLYLPAQEWLFSIKSERLVQMESLLATGIPNHGIFWLSRAGTVRKLKLGLRALHSDEQRVSNVLLCLSPVFPSSFYFSPPHYVTFFSERSHAEL